MDHLEEFAPRPVVHFSEAHALPVHCDPQWPKVGQLFSQTTYPRVTEFVCKAAWKLHLWQMRTMSYRATRAELSQNKD